MLFRNLGVPELLLILLLAILIFGPGRIGRLGAELGKSIKEFRQGLSASQPDEISDGQNNHAA